MAHRTFSAFTTREMSGVQVSFAIATSPRMTLTRSGSMDPSGRKQRNRVTPPSGHLLTELWLALRLPRCLIGSETASRRWVQYEIDQSIDRGNGLLGIYIHNIKDKDGLTASRGESPLPAGYKTYDWVYDDGYSNLGTWVDAAYDAAD